MGINYLCKESELCILNVYTGKLERNQMTGKLGIVKNKNFSCEPYKIKFSNFIAEKFTCTIQVYRANPIVRRQKVPSLASRA